MSNEELLCHQPQTRAAQAGDPERQGSTPAPVAQGHTHQSHWTPSGTFSLPHPPSGDFLSNEVLPFIRIFIGRFNSLFISVLYSFRRILKGCSPIQLPEFDKYCFCSKSPQEAAQNKPVKPMLGAAGSQLQLPVPFVETKALICSQRTIPTFPLPCCCLPCCSQIPSLALHCPKYQSQNISICRV